MSDKRPEDLSVEELRRLLLDKRRVSRKDRLDSFRRTGRVLTLAPDTEVNIPEELHLGRVVETPVEQTPAVDSEWNRKRILRDRILFWVEVVGALALVVMVSFVFWMWQSNNQQAILAFQQPTGVPTALITAVVLPSGHTPPGAANGAQPNEAEIPEHLRPLVQSLANVPIPTAGLQQAVRIQIPTISVDAPVVQGDGWEQLKKGVAQHIGTPDPGENGNIVLSAHDDIFGEIFRNLDRLKPGDTIVLSTNQRHYTYIITNTQIVEPTRVDVMNTTPNATITLISCYPYLIDNQRIVVSAVLQSP